METTDFWFCVIHLCIEWLCCFLKHWAGDPTLAFCLTCVVDSICKVLFLRKLLSEHYFNALQGILNFGQSFIIGNFLFLSKRTKHCVDSMNFGLGWYCCFVAIIQTIYLAKNVFVNHGREDLSTCAKIVPIVGVFFPLISVFVAFVSVIGTQDVRRCREPETTTYMDIFR